MKRTRLFFLTVRSCGNSFPVMAGAFDNSMLSSCYREKIFTVPRFDLRELNIATLIVMIASLVFASVGHGEVVRPGSPIVGVNRTNLAWESESKRTTILSEIHRAGIGVVRLTWREPDDQMVATLDAAREAGIAVLVEIPLSRKIVRHDANQRKNIGGAPGGRYGLSQVDLGIFERQVSHVLTLLQAHRVPIVGLQIANEFNWADFNGDLPLLDPGQSWSSFDVIPPEYRVTIEAGFENYVRMLDAARRVRERFADFARLPIISGGLADVSPNWAAKVGATIIDAPAVMDWMRTRGAWTLVDGVGIHAYVAFGVNQPLEAGLKSRLHDCGTARVASRSCWITEFGGSVSASSCDISDPVRSSQIVRTERVLGTLRPNAVTAVFYYDWDQSPSRGLVRCGTPGDAARAIRNWVNSSQGRVSK
jgi:hypothetical protein